MVLYRRRPSGVLLLLFAAAAPRSWYCLWVNRTKRCSTHRPRDVEFRVATSLRATLQRAGKIGCIDVMTYRRSILSDSAESINKIIEGGGYACTWTVCRFLAASGTWRKGKGTCSGVVGWPELAWGSLECPSTDQRAGCFTQLRSTNNSQVHPWQATVSGNGYHC